MAMLGAMSFQIALFGKLRDTADRSFNVTQKLHAPVQEQHTAVATQLDIRLSKAHQTLHDLGDREGRIQLLMCNG